jgi:hypothetical protein
MTVIQTIPVEVVTDRAHASVRVIEDCLPAVWHHTEQYTNIPIECDHGRLKARLRPMRGLKRQRSARVICAGHAFVQNLRRGHRQLGVDVPANQRVAAAFTDLARAICEMTAWPRRATSNDNATAPTSVTSGCNGKRAKSSDSSRSFLLRLAP